MTLKELRKTKEELNKKRDELLKVSNNEKNEAVRCQNNELSTVLIFRLVFSALPYVGMITIALITRGILTNLGMANILLNIPKLLVLPTFLIPSVIIGLSIDKKLTKNKRNNEFSKMTEDEKIEKEIHHKIASEKAYSKAEVLKETISKIEEKEKFIELNGEFYTSKVDNDHKAREERIDKLFEGYNKNLKSLDNLSAQSVIAENFKEERLKGYDKEKLLISSLGYGMLGTMYAIMPFLSLGLTFNAIPGLLTFFGIYGVNAAIFGGYCNYRTKQKRRIFKKLNKELGENAIEESTEYIINDEKRIKREKERLIEDASNVLGLLQEERSILEQVKEEKAISAKEKEKFSMPSYNPNKYSTFCKFDDLAGIVTSLGGKQYSINESCYIPVEELYPEEMDADEIRISPTQKHISNDSEEQKGPSLVKKM